MVCGLSLMVAAMGHGAPRAYVKPPTPPRVHAANLTYSFEGSSYLGYLAYPMGTPLAEPLPGALVGHTWTGLGAMEMMRAEQLAQRGFVAFALDVYGAGVRPTTPAAAKRASEAELADVPRFRRKLRHGMDLLTGAAARPGPAVSASALVANGYCFGGVMVLELARMGQPGVVAVTSFHGELGNLTAGDGTPVVAAVQAHHGDLDFQGAAGLLRFEDEMRGRNVSSWRTLKYGNCAHGWTDPTSSLYREAEAVEAHDTMFALYDRLGLRR